MGAVLQLFRPLTSFMVGLAVFVSALIGVGLDITSYIQPVTIAVIVAFFFALAGNALNDYLDREIDKVNHPERPIPLGRIKPMQALSYSIFFFTISLLLSLYLSFIVGFEALLIVLIALVFQIAYEKKFKHEKIIGNIIIGTQTAIAFIFGSVVVGKTLIISIFVATVAFLSIVGREIVKDIEDIRGDKDRITLPMKIGVKRAGIAAALLITLAILISLLLYYPLHKFGLEYLLVVSIADIFFIISIPLIFKNAKLARKTLKFAMLIAIVAFIIGAIFKS